MKATKAVLDKLSLENRTFTQITAKERLERKMLHPVALREAVINAIVHNDFTREVPPKFELFSDRLEITSVGSIPAGLSQEEFFMGYSIPQNKELMRVFKDLDIVDQMGSGIHRILEAYPQSIYQFSPNFIRVVIPFAKGFIESQEALKQATPEATTQAIPEADNYECAILSYCMTPKNREQIQQHLGLKNREYFRKSILKPLIDAGKLALTILDKPTSPKQKFITVQTVQ